MIKRSAGTAYLRQAASVIARLIAPVIRGKEVVPENAPVQTFLSQHRIPMPSSATIHQKYK